MVKSRESLGNDVWRFIGSRGSYGESQVLNDRRHSSDRLEVPLLEAKSYKSGNSICSVPRKMEGSPMGTWTAFGMAASSPPW